MAAILEADNINTFKKSCKKKTLARRYEELLTMEKYCDCEFVVGEEGKVKCHKLILASASPVFEAMFYGPISETENFVEILDMSLKIFKLMILYIYKDSIDLKNLTLEETIELYYGAEKYFLNKLKLECLENVKYKLRFSNILASMELSAGLDNSSLFDVCIHFFTFCCLGDKEFVEYLTSHYYHLSRNCMRNIIHFCERRKPFKNVEWFICKWCEHECEEIGLQSSEIYGILEDLNFDPIHYLDFSKPINYHYVQTLERRLYKACCPFSIDYDNFTWVTYIKTNNFISLQGLSFTSRLRPERTKLISLLGYLENIRVEITAPQDSPSLMWSYEFNKQKMSYNRNLKISWTNGIVLCPDIEYQIKLIWRPEQSEGAEYPCNIRASFVDGVQFRELDAHSGSLIESLHIVKLL